jgi:aspartate/methionine/tyrosine aminotransferase
MRDQVPAAAASAMTLLERESYLDSDPAVTDVSYGYPAGLNPRWIRDHQEHPPAGWLDVPAAEYADVVSGYFTWLLGAPRVRLAPTCSAGFVIAAQAVLDGAQDEVIVMERSFDCWPLLLEKVFRARVMYAPRASDGQPDAAAIAAACTKRTKAVVIVSPDNPLGVVCTGKVLNQVADMCRERGLALLADHCLAGLSPWRAEIPLLPGVASARRLRSWIALGDTGKILGLHGSKLGALAYPAALRDAVGAAASAHFFQHSQYDLALLATVLSDARFTDYQQQLSDQIAANWRLLRDRVAPPLAVLPLQAGCFALVDADGPGLSDRQFAALARHRYGVLTVPVSWFPVGQPSPETRIRVSLARPPEVIGKLAEALSALAASL